MTVPPPSGPLPLPAWLSASNPWWQRDDAGVAAAQLAPGEAAPCAQGGAADAMAATLLARLQGPDPPWITVIDGPRQTGKSQLLSALAAASLAGGVPGRRLCLIALEHGPLRWMDSGALVEAWQRLPGADGGAQRLLVDDFHLWPQAQQDNLAQLALDPERALVVAGIALDGCAARWRAAGLRVAHCRLAPQPFVAGGRRSAVPQDAELAAPASLRALFDWPARSFLALQPAIAALQPAFERYLLHGGFPAAAAATGLATAHRHLREQVVVRSLRWDGPGLHGVRRVDQLERTLLLAAEASGGQLDVPALCRQLEVERPTVRHFLELLEQAGLLRRVPPLGYGEQVQRARPLLTLADPGLLAALRGGLAGAPDAAQAQCALALHLALAYTPRGGQLRTAATSRHMPTLAVAAGERVLPFALHWHDAPVTRRGLPGLAAFCARARIPRAYVATRRADDFGPLPATGAGAPELMRIPAALLCHWLAAAAPGAAGDA